MKKTRLVLLIIGLIITAAAFGHTSDAKADFCDLQEDQVECPGG